MKNFFLILCLFVCSTACSQDCSLMTVVPRTHYRQFAEIVKKRGGKIQKSQPIGNNLLLWYSCKTCVKTQGCIGTSFKIIDDSQEKEQQMPVIIYRQLKCDVCSETYPRNDNELRANYTNLYSDARNAEWQIKTITEMAPGQESVESQHIRCPKHHYTK